MRDSFSFSLTTNLSAQTGDVATIDKDGFVAITGRIKELIITSGGENIPPVLIEEIMKSKMPCISQCVVIGDKRNYLTMMLTLKTKMNLETGLFLDELDEDALIACAACGSPVKTLTEAR